MGCFENGIDCVKVSEAFLGAFLSLAVAVSLLLIRDGISWLRNRGRNNRVVELAALRGGAIQIRNDGEDEDLADTELFAWLRSMLEAEKAMIAKARDI